MPANRKRLPIRVSVPIPRRMLSTSAPTFSHKLAISFIKVIFVASIAFAAYLVISELRSSITIIGLPLRTNGSYRVVILSAAFLLRVPITTLSGFIKSSTAAPSLKNSGFETTSNSASVFEEIFSCTLSAVPTGTVLLFTITLYSGYLLNRSPSSSATPRTKLRSACPSAPGGVGRHKNIISAFLNASSRFVVKVSLFSRIARSNTRFNPGS